MFPEAPVPRRIGDYQIVRRLRAEGPFEMFLAQEHGPLGFVREVTLRSVRRDPDDPKHATELAREARICSKLNHPAIARVVGFFEEGDRLVLVLEHIDGVTLSSLLARVEESTDRMPDPACAYLASAVASALAYAHAMVDETGTPTPVLHRALSPDVIHVMRDGTVKLGGFSLAKVLDKTPDSAVGLGSAGYTSPERMKGGVATERADVWALGALTFRLFGGATAASSVMQVMAGRPPSLTSVREGVPRELAAAVDAALQEDPRKRTITCAELARWLTRLTPPDEGKRALRELMEAVPEENAGEPAPVDRSSRRKVRAMQRQAPSAKMAVLRAARERGEEIEEVELADEPVEAVEVPAPAIAPVPTPPPKILTPAPKIPTPAPKIPTPAPLVEKPPESDYPHIEVKGERRGNSGARAATMLGLGPAIPKAGLLITEAPVAPPPPPPPPPEVPVVIPNVPIPTPLAKPALAKTSSRGHPIVVQPAPIAPPPPPATPTVTALDETAVLPRTRRNMLPVVFAVVAVAVLLGVVAVVFGMRTRPTPPSPPVVAKESAVPPPSAATSVQKTAVTASAAPSTTPSTSATAAETASTIAPPKGKKLPKDFGWLYVHATDTVNQRVFVAGRSRGTPGQVLMVPCGKLYVNLAKVDAKGNWRGWAASGQTTLIPCNGTVGEVTFE